MIFRRGGAPRLRGVQRLKSQADKAPAGSLSERRRSGIVPSGPSHASQVDCLAGGGRMGALMRKHDFWSTPLGPSDLWPQSLKTAVSICLSSPFPLAVWWGPSLVFLYNDAYAAILGKKHPDALGATGRELWPEVWETIGPMIEGVMSRGEASFCEDQLLAIERHGYPEEAYFTLSHSPIHDESGIGGVFTVVAETTDRVLSERRLRTLRALAARASNVTTTQDACEAAAHVLGSATHDLPFALVYLVDEAARVLRLSAVSGISQSSSLAPASIALDSDTAHAFGLSAALERQPAVIMDLERRIGPMPCSADEPPHMALVLPIAGAGTCRPYGALVAAISPRRPLDDSYRTFLELTADHVAMAISNARAHEQAHERTEALFDLDHARSLFLTQLGEQLRVPCGGMLAPLEELLCDAQGTLQAGQRSRLQLLRSAALRMHRLLAQLQDFANLQADAPSSTTLLQAAVGLDVHGIHGSTDVIATETPTASAPPDSALLQTRKSIERRRAELAALFSQSPCPTWLIRGADLSIELHNPAAQRLLDQLDQVAHVDQSDSSEPACAAFALFPGQEVAERVRGVMRSGLPASVRVVHLQRTTQDNPQRELHFELRCVPLRLYEQTQTAVAVFACEVTEPVHALRASEEGCRKVEAENRAKDEFLAMLGHELRNPLAPIATALELLRLRAVASCAVVPREQAVIERQVQHLSRLVDDLLDIARITQGKLKLRKKRLELSLAIAHATEMAMPLLQERGQRLITEVPDRGLCVEADELRLAQVVANLLTNAASYTPPGGQVRVIAQREDGEILLRVQDNGIGIETALQERVFDLFVQGKRATRSTGLGLGLTLVRSFVAMHGGTVTVRSAGHDQGSEFIVRLPMAIPASESTEHATEGEAMLPKAARPRRVLVVDDNCDAAEVLADWLKLTGYQAKVALSAPAALDVSQSFAPEVALLDIGLPVMDGYELARALRAVPGCEHMRLIAVTGHGLDTDRSRTRAAGFAAHLLKPIDFHALGSVIDRVCDEAESTG